MVGIAPLHAQIEKYSPGSILLVEITAAMNQLFCSVWYNRKNLGTV